MPTEKENGENTSKLEIELTSELFGKDESDQDVILEEENIVVFLIT